LCLVVVGRHAKPLEFFDVVLGDRPALPAVERFYQRILAEDTDEVLAQAETVLAERSLGEYYDTIVLPGLTLAARDVARGSVTAGRAAEVRRTMLSVIHELHALAAPLADTAPSRIADALVPSAGTVACIAGRGGFDDA